MLLRLWQWLCENARQLKSLSHIVPPFVPQPRVAYCTPLRNKFIVLVEEELRNVEIAFRPAFPMTMLFTCAGNMLGSYIDHRAYRIL